MEATSKVGKFLVHLAFIMICAAVFFPFWMLLSVSLSNENDIMYFGYSIVPKHFDVNAYQYVFTNSKALVDAYKVTTLFSFVYMVLSTFLMAMMAYPLSRQGLKHKGILSFVLYFTMLFSGGMVASYILITQYLHMNDTIWVYILPGMISPWYVFMLRTFFSEIPDTIEEAAKIDGCSDFGIFIKIVLPLSKPVIATVALFGLLGKWNSWIESMLYINRDQSLYSLQYLLQLLMKNIELIKINQNIATDALMANIPSETARMAMAVLVAGPALIVFPFFQKYFVKGLTVGSVKG